MKTNLSSFLQLDDHHIELIKHDYETPLYIFNEAGIVKRFLALKQAAEKRYPQSMIAVSYKTNFLKGLLYRLHQEGAHAEVVSDIEYEVANQIKKSDQLIVFNGPYKTNAELERAIGDQAIINCDNVDEIKRIEGIAERLNIVVPIGLRLYLVDSNSSWKRFGIPVNSDGTNADFTELVKKIVQSKNIKLTGLHSHIGTNIRDLNQFKQFSTYLCKIAFFLKNHFNLELAWLDVGGGLSSISPYRHETEIEVHPLPDANNYMDAIIQPLLPYLTQLKKPAKLIFEPGRTIFEAFGTLLTKVVGIRESLSENTQSIILDAGFNILATSHVYNFPLHYFSEEKRLRLTHLQGPSCNQSDQLHNPILLPIAKKGDLLLFYGVGSYCFSFSYSFIRFKPRVVLLTQDTKLVTIRERETLDNNTMIGHIPDEMIKI